MKKFRVALVTALVLLVSMLCLVACGGVTGTYKFESMEMKMGIITTTIKAGEEYEGEKLDANSVTLTLEKDGVAKMKTIESDTEIEGTWEEKDGNIDVTVDGETVSFKKDGSKLIWVMGEEGMTMTITLSK
ncbi:MAG: hypothetical protein K2N84_06095 [Clostridia bacterium]|nr:hypothetical protein [Clostridia bacterium]